MEVTAAVSRARHCQISSQRLASNLWRQDGVLYIVVQHEQDFLKEAPQFLVSCLYYCRNLFEYQSTRTPSSYVLQALQGHEPSRIQSTSLLAQVGKTRAREAGYVEIGSRRFQVIPLHQVIACLPARGGPAACQSHSFMQVPLALV